MRVVRSFLLLLAPLGVTLFVGGALVLPVLGYVGAGLALFVSVVVAAWGPRWLERPGTLLLGVSLSAWLLLIGVGVVVGMFTNHMTNGSDWCGSTPLVAGRCAGKDQSFLQGRRSYSETEGQADRERCRELSARGERALTEAALPDDNELHAVECPWSEDGWSCFAKKHVSAGHDRYVTLYGFSSDCARGRAWSLTNVGFAEMSTLAPELRAGRR